MRVVEWIFPTAKHRHRPTPYTYVEGEYTTKAGPISVRSRTGPTYTCGPRNLHGHLHLIRHNTSAARHESDKGHRPAACCPLSPENHGHGGGGVCKGGFSVHGRTYPTSFPTRCCEAGAQEGWAGRLGGGCCRRRVAAHRARHRRRRPNR
jgi:hypothetical protein